MRLRLIAFVPPALLMTLVLLLSMSTFVSAVERSLVGDSEIVTPPIRVQRFETECETLYREMYAISRAATSCDEEPSCLGSPLLCPVMMDDELEAEYQQLRTELIARCGDPHGLAARAFGGPVAQVASCSVYQDWHQPSPIGPVGPGRFVF